MRVQYETHSARETEALAETLGRKAFPGAVIALYGPLGAGKTAFVRGLARGMGLPDDIASPTFALMHVHEGLLPLYHFDLYRLSGEDELETVGADEYWFGSGVSAVEWAERAGSLLPIERLDVIFRLGEGDDRTLVCTALGCDHERFLEDPA